MTTDFSKKSWLSIAADSDFSLQNLPFGIFKTGDKKPRIGVAIGDQVIDTWQLAKRGYLDELDIPKSIFRKKYLNQFMALGKEKTSAVRARIFQLFEEGNREIRENADQDKLLVAMEDAEMMMPVKVGDYTDFYSSIEHATNVGTMFRDPNNALLPNWRHLPVGYHGRASSIVLSGTPLHRPKGQTKGPDDEAPKYGPSQRVDFELEMAFVTCKENGLGNQISTEQAEEYIFGFCLFNDWSARDIQTWEYVPLGPFLAKNFGSSISPWIVTIDALEAFRCAGPDQQPAVLDYLQYEGNKNYDINLSVAIMPEAGEETVVCNSNFKHMYWNVNQQLAHHTVNGCNISVGDMYASGTISGPTEDSYGSMLELAWKGTKPVKLANGEERKFIQDNDTVVMNGSAEKEGVRVGFGEVRTKLLPAK